MITRFDIIIIISFIFLFFLNSSYNYATKNNDMIVLFSHGIADSHKQAYRYAPCYPINERLKEIYVNPEQLSTHYEYAYNNRYIITCPYISFDFLDVTDGFYGINPRKSGLAQTVDIERFSTMFHKTQQHYNKDIILMGVSRGASTIINFMGQHKADAVQALILESPFDALETIIEYKIKQAQLHKVPGLKQLSHALVSLFFFKYHMNGVRPIDQVQYIAQEVPILLICSQEDNLVPSQSTINLYKKLRITNHNHVHLVITKHGKHARIIEGMDGDKYQQITHAFLRTYNLPHNTALADAGQQLFAQTQPTIEELITF